ncbi:MAG: helix-turn-helix domain-containing protein [Planctomycetes bacterium]|nr:helix-turn-helix domain-containing protein [Planctomycetota bacterium]
MAKDHKEQVKHAECVIRFGKRLKDVRGSRGMTQAELAKKAQVTASYVWRLESGGAAPGIDLVERLATALGTTSHDLLPLTAAPDTLGLLQEQARSLFERLMKATDREGLMMLNPLLARLLEAAER